jgi:PAS domain S-box-containing protein
MTVWNAVAAQLYGYAEDEVLARHWSPSAIDVRDDPFDRLMRVLASAGKDRFQQAEVTGKRGRAVSVWACTEPLAPDGAASGFISVSYELTELQRNESRSGALLDAAPDAIVCVDSEGRIVLVNAQTERMFGYPRHELIGQAVEMLVPTKVRAGHPAHRLAYMAEPHTRPMGAGLALSARRKDGSEFPVDISLSSLETSDGMLVSAAVRDITDRKRADEERALLEARLQKAQRDEERASFEARLHQAQRLESVGLLAGGIAHDFNNLLAGIMNYASLVTDGLDELTARFGIAEDAGALQVARDVEEIVKVASRAAQLVHQLLIFSRREVVKPEVLDLNVVVLEMEKLLRRTIGETIYLSTKLADDLPKTKVDRGQMEQVLMNLAVNARDAMAGTNGMLLIETAPFDADSDFAEQHTIAAGSYARLTVSDTGQGMSPEVLSRVFEPFFTTKGKGEGSGLGLATVYGIVTQAGGQVVIYSEPCFGTTVRVLLPATEDQRAAGRVPGGQQAASAQPRATETILLVEDEEMVREPARRILSRQGYAVLVASNAEHAARLISEHQGEVHLLLTDVVMPGRTGKELAADMTARLPGIKVLFMSGYTQDVIVHQGALEEGVNLVEKPFAADMLLAKVREILDT